MSDLRSSGLRAQGSGFWSRGLLFILLAGAALRILLLMWLHDEPLYIYDERDYNQLAVSLATDGRLLDQYGQPASLRPPLYPALVAAVYRVCGLENYQAVRAIQAVAGLGLVLVVYALARGMYGNQAAVWAAGLCCFYPGLVGFGNLLLTETLFALLMCGACLALQRSFASQSFSLLTLAGLLFGLAALTRSVLWLFPPLLLGYLLLATHGWAWRQRLVTVLLPTLSLCLTLVPWAIRNTRVEKTLVVVDTMGGRNFMMGNYEYTPLFRAWDAIKIGGEQAWYHVLAGEHSDFAATTQGQRDKLALRYGLRFVAEHPGLTAQRDLVKFVNFWQLEREVPAGLAQGFWGDLPRPAVAALSVVIVGSYAAAIIAGIFGFLMVPTVDARTRWLMLLLVALICGIHTLVFGHSRYHLSLMPLVLVFSASAIVEARAILKQWRQWRFWLAALLSAGMAASWVWQLYIDSTLLT